MGLNKENSNTVVNKKFQPDQKIKSQFQSSTEQQDNPTDWETQQDQYGYDLQKDSLNQTDEDRTKQNGWKPEERNDDDDTSKTMDPQMKNQKNRK